jgi:tetratricopeptide (TPR) repeat protein
LLGEEEYGEAVRVLEEWLAAAQEVTPKEIFNIAYANYMHSDVKRAEALMEKIFHADPRPMIKNSWYQVYYRILFDLGKYGEAEALVIELLSIAPGSEQYWRLLASHYLQLEDSGEALAALMIAYWNKLIDDGDDLQRIVSLYGFVDAPEKAARLLETWLGEEKIPEDSDSLQQLGNLWLLARHRDKAKSALEKAASTAEDGNIYQMLGGIHFEDEDWAAAHAAYQRALRSGGLEEPRRVYLLAGISAYRVGMKDEARSALEQAAMSDKYEEQARSLLRRLDDA